MSLFVGLVLACLLQTNVAFTVRSFRSSSPLQISSTRGQRQNLALSMSFGGIAEKLGGIVEFISGQQKVTEANIEDTLKEVKSILIDADVNLAVANTLIAKVKARAIGMKVEEGQKPGEQFISLLAAELVEIMGQAQVPLNSRSDGRPNVILMAGLQGAGKTTAVAKLATWALKKEYSKKILLVAADIYRPAAIEQLQTLGARLGDTVAVYTEGQDVSPVKICRNALAKAIAEGYDTVIVDTAGRQVVDQNLMDELKQIKSAIQPDETLLVVDAMTGQEAATLTARFNEDIGITGAILTKMDGDTRGGSALSVRGVSGKPIKFVGVGEGMDDLEPFYPERMASRILGMGDIATFLEKAQGALDAEKTSKLGRKMQKGDFDFDDFLLQTQSVRKMGGMASMLKMIPGAAGKVTDENMFAIEKRLKQSEFIISCMSEEERCTPDLLARTIDAFIQEFSGMRKMMVKNLKGMDMNAMEADPNKPMQTAQDKAAQAKKDKKVKPSRGGGGGFGSR